RRHTSSKRDWGSDVCSSDLLGRKRMIKRNIVKFAVGVLTVAVLVPLFVYASDKNTDIEAHKAQAEESQSSAMTDFVEDTLEEEQIGRASCREREKITERTSE